MTTPTLAEKAVTGRRVTFTYYRDLDQADAPAHPGIITGTEPGYSGALLARIRLDGTRSNLHIPVDYDGITYLDQVVPVPVLPMGRFIPTADQLEGEWEGVLLCSIGEDGDLIALTTDHDMAVRAMSVYRREMAGCLYNPEADAVDARDVQARWAVFEWEPEDAECPWTVDWDAAEGDDQALHIYYLPA
jgi:hypothetical protein